MATYLKRSKEQLLVMQIFQQILQKSAVSQMAMYEGRIVYYFCYFNSPNVNINISLIYIVMYIVMLRI